MPCTFEQVAPTVVESLVFLVVVRLMLSSALALFSSPQPQVAEEPAVRSVQRDASLERTVMGNGLV